MFFDHVLYEDIFITIATLADIGILGLMIYELPKVVTNINEIREATNPVVYTVIYEQNSRYERCENKRNSDLAPYQLSLPANAEFGTPMFFSCVTVIPADLTPVFGGFLLVPFDQSPKPLRICEIGMIQNIVCGGSQHETNRLSYLEMLLHADICIEITRAPVGITSTGAESRSRRGGEVGRSETGNIYRRATASGRDCIQRLSQNGRTRQV